MTHAYVHGHTSKWVMSISRVYMCHGSEALMTHSYVCHDSLIPSRRTCHDSEATMTHSYCVPWLIDICAMTPAYVCHDSLIPSRRTCHDSEVPLRQSCHIWVLVSRGLCVSHMCIGHGTHMIEKWHTFEWVTAHVWVRHSTRMNETCHT